jgi:hypothetical protein
MSMSVYIPDSDVRSVSAGDIQDGILDPRMAAPPDVGGTTPSFSGIPFVIVYPVTTGNASIKIYDANAPVKFEIIDVIVQARGASTNGTVKLTNGTGDITNAMICAVNKTIVRAGTIDVAYSTIAVAGTLIIVCAGDVPASTIGLVTIVAIKR